MSKGPQNGAGRALAGVFAVVLITGAGFFARFGTEPTSAQAPDAGLTDAAVDPVPEEPAPETPSRRRLSGPQRVSVGAYLRNVENIDLASNSYSLSVDLWMKWRSEERDPTGSFRLTNVIDRSSLTITPVYPEPVELDGGFRYQRFHVEGTFWHKFWLGTFPLDWQRVTLELEDTHHEVGELVYVPDREASGVHPTCQIPGWLIVEETNEAFEAELATDLGMGSQSPGNTFPGYRFGLRIERPISFYLFKILPPVLITLACCFLVFLLKPVYVDARVGTPIAALLTAVFLQLTFTGGLPSVGITFLIDHVFNLTYTVIFVIALVCMVTTRMNDTVARLQTEVVDAEVGEARTEIQERISRLSRIMRRLDRTMLAALPVVYLLGIGLITIIVRGTYFFEMLGR